MVELGLQVADELVNRLLILVVDQLQQMQTRVDGLGGHRRLVLELKPLGQLAAHGAGQRESGRLLLLDVHDLKVCEKKQI